jgi:hypothetical protein
MCISHLILLSRYFNIHIVHPRPQLCFAHDVSWLPTLLVQVRSLSMQCVMCGVAVQDGARARQEALQLALDDLIEWLNSSECTLNVRICLGLARTVYIPHV